MSRNLTYAITCTTFEEKIAWWLAIGNRRKRGERSRAVASNSGAEWTRCVRGWGEYFERPPDDLAARGISGMRLLLRFGDNYYRPHASEPLRR